MTAQHEVRYGGGLGAVPRGPQKSAVVVSGPRLAVMAPFVPVAKMPVSDANGGDPNLVRSRDRRSCGLLARRAPRKAVEGGRR